MWRYRQAERQHSAEGDEDQQFHDQGGLHIIAYAHTIACQERDRQHPVPQVEILGTL
jgi:hypothetical protein